MSKLDKLDEILEKRRERVAEAKQKISLQELEIAAKAQPAPVSFLKAINQSDRVSIIAEVKRKSPSAGPIRPQLNMKRVAQSYEKGGAAAISVLTEPDWFEGKIEDLVEAHRYSKLPILRKDFVFDPYQIVEAKAAGASAVLLIADMVSAESLKELASCATENGLDALVEVFSEGSIKAALDTGSKIIGINKRDLRTLKMNLNRVEELMKEIPADRVLVAESGIKNAADVATLRNGRVRAVLIGESLLKQTDLQKAVEAVAEAGENEG